MQTLKPDYVYRKGEEQLDGNADARSLDEARDLVERAGVAASQTFAGALIAQSLALYTDSNEFDIHLSGDNEYADEGGYFFSPSVSVDEEQHSGDQGQALESNLQNGYESGIYDACKGHDARDGSSFTIHVDRAALAHLLNQEEVSGADVWALLRVTDVS